MRVTGEFVLVEQTDVKKENSLIIPGKDANQEYETFFKIKEIGPLVPKEYGLRVGLNPVFSTHFQALAFQKTSKKLEKKVITANLVIHYADIVGIE